jgi:Domain of unknown function (DUF4157)
MMNAGRTLPRSLRREMEDLFGADFRPVRVRESDRAWPLGCTWGEDVRLASAVCDPSTEAGREVLGHELAHVLQQQAGRVRGGNGWALEAEAAAAGRAILRGQPVSIPGRAAARPTEAVQCYNVVLPAGRVAAGVALVNPQHTVPFNATDSFLGQDKGGWAGNPRSFLLAAGGAVNITAANTVAANIRVSNNGNMAIEDADLLTRQPKVCYLANGLINASNMVLAAQNSDVRLVPDAPGINQRMITVNGVNLIRVTPQNVSNGTAGLAMMLPQSCDALVLRVLGHAPNPQFLAALAYPPHPVYEYNIARALVQVPPLLPPALPAPGALPGVMAAGMAAIALRFAGDALAAAGPFVGALQNHGINQWAAPNIGQGFLTVTLISGGLAAAVPPGPPTLFDHYHLVPGAGIPQVVGIARTWNTHWAGVVAADGADVITLENYARNTEDALVGADTRYYFQMYDTVPAAPAGAGSWHHAWTSTPMQPIVPPPPAPGPGHPAATYEPVSPGARSFANPITIMVG